MRKTTGKRTPVKRNSKSKDPISGTEVSSMAKAQAMRKTTARSKR